MQPFLENTDRRSQNDGRSPVGENDYIHQSSHTTMHIFSIVRFSNFFWTGFNVVNNAKLNPF